MGNETTKTPIDVDGEIGRLREVYEALNKMGADERGAAIIWLKRKFPREWPYEG